MWDLAYREDFKPDVALRLVENALAFPTATVCCVCDLEGGADKLIVNTSPRPPCPGRKRTSRSEVFLQSTGLGVGYVEPGWDLAHVGGGM